jgi:hypothetical protein
MSQLDQKQQRMLNVRSSLPAQPVEATQALNLSAGVAEKAPLLRANHGHSSISCYGTAVISRTAIYLTS